MEDIRLLGRLLGDVIREQEGAAYCADRADPPVVGGLPARSADTEADKALKQLLVGQSDDQTVSDPRLHPIFSHLANPAEDRHHIRRRAIHERDGDIQPGSLRCAAATSSGCG